MGFVVGLVAAGVGLVGAYFAAEFVAPWLGLAVLAVVGLGFGIPMHRHGHRQFGGGGNTDLWLFVMVFGIILALAIPRYNRARSCGSLDAYAAWMRDAQGAFFDQNQRFAESLDDLVGFPPDTPRPPGDQIRVSVESLSANDFVAALSHPSCPAPVSLEVLREGGGPPSN